MCSGTRFICSQAAGETSHRKRLASMARAHGKGRLGTLLEEPRRWYWLRDGVLTATMMPPGRPQPPPSVELQLGPSMVPPDRLRQFAPLHSFAG